MKKWYQDWVEVFKSGVHTDSKGVTRTWSNEDLDAIVHNYNPNELEAPVVIGHPATDAPAYGWVEKVKRDKDRLMVKFKKVVPEFLKLVDNGMYRKVSVAINANNTLRHVGFLGAVPPAVKGLQHAFSNDEGYFAYEQGSDGSAEAQGSEFASLQAAYDGLMQQNKRLEAKHFVSNLCREGRINSAYAQLLEDTICTLESTPSNAFAEGDGDPAKLMREFLCSLSPRCTFGELATQAPKKPLSPETELGLRIARSL